MWLLSLFIKKAYQESISKLKLKLKHEKQQFLKTEEVEKEENTTKLMDDISKFLIFPVIRFGYCLRIAVHVCRAVDDNTYHTLKEKHLPKAALKINAL